MLFKTLKLLAMIIPQSTCFRILRDRLTSVSRFRQSTNAMRLPLKTKVLSSDTKAYVTRVVQVRTLHCDAAWKAIRTDSLETPTMERETLEDEGADKRSWLGYASKEEEASAQHAYRESKHNLGKKEGLSIQEISSGYDNLETMKDASNEAPEYEPYPSVEDEIWRQYWAEE